MTDEERTELVKRLMTSVTLTFTLPGGAQAADQIETDGDRIKELEAENERLRDTPHRIWAEARDSEWDEGFNYAVKLFRAALAGDSHVAD